MGCSPSREGLDGETALNHFITDKKQEDVKIKSLNSVTFVEHDLVWSAGKEHKTKPSKFGEVCQAIRIELTPTKFMQQQVRYVISLSIFYKL